jgi:hypothetical protein
MTSDPGSFAHFTIAERKPRIIRQVIEDNDYPPDIVQELEALSQELTGHPLRPLSEQVPDVAQWNRELAAVRGRTWMEIPWYFAEAYLYRRLLEAVRYFQPGPWQGHDPFGKQKRQQEEIAVARLAADWRQLADAEPVGILEILLHSCLWGNRVDLTKYLAAMPSPTGLAVREERRHILIDHTDEVLKLLAGGLHRVDFVNDNVGADLLSDLALADFLLVRGWVRETVFHLKDRPFFVSDAMPPDVRATISLLRAVSDPAVQELGTRMDGHLQAGRLVMKADPVWTSSLMFRRLPPPLRADLARSDLAILKGDLNYRRLLDDRRWPHTTPLEKIAHYFPAPLLVLRTLKAELIAGLKPGQAEALSAADPTWLIDGKRGIIHLMNRRTKRK